MIGVTIVAVAVLVLTLVDVLAQNTIPGAPPGTAKAFKASFGVVAPGVTVAFVRLSRAVTGAFIEIDASNSTVVTYPPGVAGTEKTAIRVRAQRTIGVTVVPVVVLELALIFVLTQYTVAPAPSRITKALKATDRVVTQGVAVAVVRLIRAGALVSI
eukprot:3938188-Rhodomonas_salina.1